MTGIRTIAKKELRAYFTSPVAYVVFTVFAVLSGFFFYSLINWFNTLSLQLSQNPSYYAQLNINQQVFAPLFNNMSIILLLMIPLLTMRLFAEEKKNGTEEMLFTSPISVNRIILGKYFAALWRPPGHAGPDRAVGRFRLSLRKPRAPGLPDRLPGAFSDGGGLHRPGPVLQRPDRKPDRRGRFDVRSAASVLDRQLGRDRGVRARTKHPRLRSRS